LNLRRLTSLLAIALLLTVVTSCGTIRRAGKDLGVVVASPVLILYGGGTDALATSHDVREGLDGNGITEATAFVPAFLFHTVKHAVWVVVHALDFLMFPFYGLGELHPYGDEVKPLDIYTGTIFDKESDERRPGATDPGSGELVEAPPAEATSGR
jgi:hypothetical protein